MSNTGTISKKSASKAKGTLKKSKGTPAANSGRRAIAKFKTKREANKQADRIIRSLNEAKEIKAGNKIGTSFDDFLTAF